MIEVTRLDNSKMFVNVELIQSLQATPDTIITFTSREKIMVKEPVGEISRKIFEYQRSIHNSGPISDREADQLLLLRTTQEGCQDSVWPQRAIDKIPEILR